MKETEMNPCISGFVDLLPVLFDSVDSMKTCSKRYCPSMRHPRCWKVVARRYLLMLTSGLVRS
jgi:hypothetical protein